MILWGTLGYSKFVLKFKIFLHKEATKYDTFKLLIHFWRQLIYEKTKSKYKILDFSGEYETNNNFIIETC